MKEEGPTESSSVVPPRVASSRDSRLPPPRFGPSSDTSLQGILEDDPLLKLIPAKRPASLAALAPREDRQAQCTAENGTIQAARSGTAAAPSDLGASAAGQDTVTGRVQTETDLPLTHDLACVRRTPIEVFLPV